MGNDLILERKRGIFMYLFEESGPKRFKIAN